MIGSNITSIRAALSISDLQCVQRVPDHILIPGVSAEVWRGQRSEGDDTDLCY